MVWVLSGETLGGRVLHYLFIQGFAHFDTQAVVEQGS